MEKAGVPAEISEFDYEHFCNGNSINCYYYRKAEEQKVKPLKPRAPTVTTHTTISIAVNATKTGYLSG
jgi:hypothetical protein